MLRATIERAATTRALKRSTVDVLFGRQPMEAGPSLRYKALLVPLAIKQLLGDADEDGQPCAVYGVTKDGDLVIRAELPGVKMEDVDITLQNGVLTISGEHKADQEEERGGYHVRERRYGSFRRSMTLPEGTDESKVHARFEDGVLEVTVEGAAIEQAPKRIEIEGSSG